MPTDRMPTDRMPTDRMSTDVLRVALAQWNLIWEFPEANFDRCIELLDVAEPFDLGVLPEMFSSGFTMRPAAVASNIGERAHFFLQHQARQRDAGFCGSTIQQLPDGAYANRFYLCDGAQLDTYYDKRHLFAPAGEHEAFRAGLPHPTILEFRGWRILPQVCYDLRFPVFSHNAGCRYDLAIYVASWPATRREHWRALLRARAIENQCYVIGVNRTGDDGRGLSYAGDSCVFDASGHCLLDLGDQEVAQVVTLDLETLRSLREKLPFLQDSDHYELVTR